MYTVPGNIQYIITLTRYFVPILIRLNWTKYFEIYFLIQFFPNPEYVHKKMYKVLYAPRLPHGSVADVLRTVSGVAQAILEA